MKPSSLTARRLVVAVGMLVIGTFGIAGSGVLTVPAWRAAHGAGHAGTFTLTEPMSCDRHEPPRQRCGWFGDFVSDDGMVVRRDLELSGGLPPGAKIGDTLSARDTGSPAQIYQANDTHGWKQPAGFLTGFVGAFVQGAVLLKPWSWWIRPRRQHAGPR